MVFVLNGKIIDGNWIKCHSYIGNRYDVTCVVKKIFQRISYMIFNPSIGTLFKRNSIVMIGILWLGNKDSNLD